MADSYDRNERRAPRSREGALLRELRGILSVSKSRAAALRWQLKGIDIEALKTRADLARIPVLRKAELVARQRETPFGGACSTRLGALAHLLMSADHSFQPEGHAKDWWNCARALFAAGIRKGDIVVNCFSYHLGPDGHMVDRGCDALGCPVIPAGTSALNEVIAVIDHFKPIAYCGPADYLAALLECGPAAEHPTTSLTCAFVGPTLSTAAVKADIAAHGITPYEAYATNDLGVVAYESEAHEALIVNEGLIVEIVRPGTNAPSPAGQIGEIVVTRLNPDYPLLRFGTGDLSCVVPGQSPCGRTNMRIRRVTSRVDEAIAVAGGIIAPAHVTEIGERMANVGGLRLVIRAEGATESLILQTEGAPATEALRNKYAEALFAVSGLKAAVEIVAPGTLPADGKTICDERPRRP